MYACVLSFFTAVLLSDACKCASACVSVRVLFLLLVALARVCDFRVYVRTCKSKRGRSTAGGASGRRRESQKSLRGEFSHGEGHRGLSV